MRLLFDTHLVLWALEGSRKLPAQARALLQDEANEQWVSAASLWEVAIKVGIGKLALRREVSEVEALIKHAGFKELPITMRHASAVARGDRVVRDPFDRLLLAQCEVESLKLVSADGALRDSSWVIAV